MTITIDKREDICSSCCRPFKHKIRYSPRVKINDYEYSEPLEKGIKYVEMVTMCLDCRILYNKRKEIMLELTDIDFEIFRRQSHH
jgi:hypothetical protein